MRTAGGGVGVDAPMNSAPEGGAAEGVAHSSETGRVTPG